MARLRRSGLSRHIIVSMSLMVIGVIVMMILSSWLLYAVLVEFFPGSAEEPESWLPTGPELAWMVGVILTGLALAIAASFRLAHRILSPLNSLVDSVRALAGGDLGTRQRRGKLRRAKWPPWSRTSMRWRAACSTWRASARCGTRPLPMSCARR
jgi:methyl-accepting chemotaxis protein